MEYIINEDPSIFTERHEGKSYPFLAKEEIFSIVNEALGYAISLDFIEQEKKTELIHLRRRTYTQDASSGWWIILDGLSRK